MRLALAQMQMELDMEENFRKTIRLMREAAERGAEFICFPELQLSPFFPQYEGKDVSAFLLYDNDSHINEICCVCRETGIFASPNFYIEENGRRYDMSLLIDDHGKIIGKQKMVHIAQCLRGAELIVIPTANTTAEPSEMFQWEVKVQAFQNSVNIAMCNRVGTEDAMAFSGESILVDYNGTTLALAGSSEELLIAEVNLVEATENRGKKPYTNLRKKEFYE